MHKGLHIISMSNNFKEHPTKFSVAFPPLSQSIALVTCLGVGVEDSYDNTLGDIITMLQTQQVTLYCQ